MQANDAFRNGTDDQLLLAAESHGQVAYKPGSTRSTVRERPGFAVSDSGNREPPVTATQANIPMTKTMPYVIVDKDNTKHSKAYRYSCRLLSYS
eukprot:6212200-Pleurochrysis_carterae.AAC.3